MQKQLEHEKHYTVTIHEAQSVSKGYVMTASARQYQNKKSELKERMLKLVK